MLHFIPDETINMVSITAMHLHTILEITTQFDYRN